MWLRMLSRRCYRFWLERHAFNTKFMSSTLRFVTSVRRMTAKMDRHLTWLIYQPVITLAVDRG